jgi:predicted XRE-type DNA-binding protein
MPHAHRPRPQGRKATYASVWDAIAYTPEQAANWRTRAELMQQIAALVATQSRTQKRRRNRSERPKIGPRSAPVRICTASTAGARLGRAVDFFAASQTEAARRCGVTQPRINDLLRGRVSRFSLDALVNIATALGRQVRVELEAA